MFVQGKLSQAGFNSYRGPATMAVLLASSLFCPPAFAIEFATQRVELGHLNATVVSSAVFYTCLFTMIFALLGVSIALKRYIWSAYMGLIAMGLAYVGLLEQNVTGIVWSGLALEPRELQVFGYLTTMCIVALASYSITPDHPFTRFKMPLRVAAVLVWIPWLTSLSLPLDTSILLFNVVAASSGIIHFIPLATFTRLQGGPDQLIRYLIGFVLVCAVFAAVFISFGWFGFDVHLTTVNRVVMALCLIAFSFLFLNQIIVVRSDREQVIQKSLDQAMEQARINKELLEAEKRYSAAREVARLQNMRLATASHDIRQPISSLRTSIAVLAQNKPPEVQEQLKTAFEYLDQLAASYMEEAREGKSPDIATDAPVANPVHDDERPALELNASEPVSVDLITKTLQRRFRDEANGKDLGFNVKSVDRTIEVHPLALMRVLSNLISNAIKHTRSGTVSLIARVEGPQVAFEVANNTHGDFDKLDPEGQGLFDPWQKGEGSSGFGLGLAIVRQQAETAGLSLQHTSSPEAGTKFTLMVPLKKEML